MSIFSHHFLSSGTKRHSQLRLRRTGGGFTLIELLVVLAIITILTALILFQNHRFDSSTLLRSLAYNIALTVRQAQVYGTSVRQFGSAAGSFSYSYGVYFSSGDTTHYYLFADVNGNHVYDSSPTDEKVQLFTLGTGYSITTFCGLNGTAMTCSAACPVTLPVGISTCSTNGVTLASLSIYFKRPTPDSQFSTPGGVPYSTGYVQITSPAGGTNTRSITVTSTGQISVGALGS